MKAYNNGYQTTTRSIFQAKRKKKKSQHFISPSTIAHFFRAKGTREDTPQ
jgi:hypothetical protein